MLFYCWLKHKSQDPECSLLPITFQQQDVHISVFYCISSKPTSSFYIKSLFSVYQMIREVIPHCTGSTGRIEKECFATNITARERTVTTGANAPDPAKPAQGLRGSHSLSCWTTWLAWWDGWCNMKACSPFYHGFTHGSHHLSLQSLSNVQPWAHSYKISIMSPHCCQVFLAAFHGSMETNYIVVISLHHSLVHGNII